MSHMIALTDAQVAEWHAGHTVYPSATETEHGVTVALQDITEPVALVALTYRAEASYMVDEIEDDEYRAIYDHASSIVGADVIEALSHPDMPGIRATSEEFRAFAADDDVMRDVLARARVIAAGGAL